MSATVTLIHPDGEREYNATSPSEVYQLTSLGYRVKDGSSIDDAAAALMPAAKTAAAKTSSKRTTPPATSKTSTSTDAGAQK